MSIPTREERDATGWSASTYNKVASFVYSEANTSAVFQLLDAKPGERILDLGCGSGELTKTLAQAVGENGIVVGVDASDSMIEKARQNGVQATFVADAQDLSTYIPPRASASELARPMGGVPDSFDFKFDAVFSNATLHWCKRDPEGAIKSVASVLDKGGRFVGEMGGYMNCVGIRSAIHTVLKHRGYDPETLDPWNFPSPESYKKLLAANGFDVKHISLTPRLTPVSSIIDWQRSFVYGPILEKAGMSKVECEDVMQEVQQMVRMDCWGGEEQGWGIIPLMSKPSVSAAWAAYFAPEGEPIQHRENLRS